jgi:NADP-dependent 3-hydroxy acid dehydrogenase YdfG/acyl carrier protein
MDIEIILNNVHAVTGGETLNPEKATILGACKIIPLEYSNVRCRSIDIVVPEPGTQSEQTLVKQLLGEFSTKPSDPVIAYRAGYRWVEMFERIHLEVPAGVASRLKVNGVYLITGGLGGVGLALAEFLAASVQARLILVGRSVMPPASQWEDWLATHDAGDETSCRIKKIQFIERAGAQVLVAAADTADRKRMREVITLAKCRFGRVDGVIHAAGSADHGGLIQRRTKEATEQMLAAKVKGTLVLDELLADSGLDFFVLCSTRGNVVSSGAHGQVGYIAANEFLDAFASYKKARNDVYTVTINWDPWRDVGMAARASKEQARTGKAARVLTGANSLSPPEGAKVFNCILNYSFARIVVSVADLDAVRRDLSKAQRQPAMKQEAGRTEPVSHPRPDLGIAITPPTNESERKLANIWQELLGIEEVGVDDNFFDLGGDSLLLLRVQLKISQSFGANLSSAELFQHSTVSALARRLSQSEAEPAGLGEVRDRAQLQRAALARRGQTIENEYNLRWHRNYRDERSLSRRGERGRILAQSHRRGRIHLLFQRRRARGRGAGCGRIEKGPEMRGRPRNCEGRRLVRCQLLQHQRPGSRTHRSATAHLSGSIVGGTGERRLRSGASQRIHWGLRRHERKLLPFEQPLFAPRLDKSGRPGGERVA